MERSLTYSPSHPLSHPSLFPHQINITGLCDSAVENITVDVPPGSNIVVDQQGPCLVLSGSDTLENYRQTILTARCVIMSL